MLDDIIYSVGDIYQTIDVPLYIDFVSQRFGGGNIDYCGPRTIGTYTPISTYQAYLELKAEERQLVVGTSNNGAAGVYSFDLIDFLDVKVL